MNKYNKEKTLKLHREMWQRLAANPSLDKEAVLIAMNINPGTIKNYCFCCEYAKNASGGEEDVPEMCRFCPLEWPEVWDGNSAIRTCIGIQRNFLFNRWEKSDSITERMAIAKHIRDLPSREPAEFFRVEVEECPAYYALKAINKDGDDHDLPYIARIYKDGSGMQLCSDVNNRIFRSDKNNGDHTIHIIEGGC